MAKIDEFVAWTRSNPDVLKNLRYEQVFTDMAEDLLSDPQFGPSIRGLLNSIRTQSPDGAKGRALLASKTVAQ